MSRTTRTIGTTGTTGTTRARRLGRALAVLAAAAALVALAAGCSANSPAPTAEQPGSAPVATFPVTVTDDASRTVTIPAEPQRIVSLAPASTEMLFALGLGDKVVGVTTYDDYPADVVDIDKMGDFTGPNVEAIAAAKPDLIVATTGVQADIIAKLEDLGAIVIAHDPATLEGLYADIEELGQATGATQPAAALVASMRANVDEVSSAIKGRETVTAFVEIGQNPLFTVGKGTLIDELLTLAGGTNVVKQAGYVPYSAEQVVKDDPAVYLATKGSMSDPAQLKQRAGLSSLTAVKGDRVVILDDNLVSRPGPRIVEGLRTIAEGLHPGAFGK